MSLFDSFTEKFRTLEKIGVGRFCEIRRFTHYGSGLFEKTFVLKRLLSHEQADAAGIAALEHEARILSSISHPSVAGVVDYLKTKDGGCLFLEWVPGLDLKRLMDGKENIDPAAWWAMLLLLGEAMQGYQQPVQGLQVIHRDLIAANVMVLPDGNIRLIDFGSAMDINDPSVLAPTAQDPLFRGRVGFLPPEVYAEKPADFSFDFFMIGVLAYRLASGIFPFRGGAPEEVLHEVLAKKPMAPSKTQRGFSKYEDEFIFTCLEKNPDNRFDDAKSFLAEVKRLLTKTKHDEACLLPQSLVRDAFYET